MEKYGADGKDDINREFLLNLRGQFKEKVLGQMKNGKIEIQR